MNDLLEFLFRNPILLLIVVSWLVSMVGGFAQRAAKKAEAEKRRQAGQGARRPEPQAKVGEAGAGRSARQLEAERIAREIRRSMGLEEPKRTPSSTPTTPPPLRAEAKPQPLREEAKPQPQPRVAPRAELRPKVVVVPDRPHQRAVSGGLAAEMAARDAADKARDHRERQLGRLQGRNAHLGDAVSDRHLAGSVDDGGGPRGRRRRRPSSRILDLTRPSGGFLALEVLGPPMALRDQVGPQR